MSSITFDAAARLAESMPERLIVMALDIESRGVFEEHDVPVLYTGLGKINAAIALTRRLAAYRHAGRTAPQVINFGTAGSRRFVTGTLVGCHRFVQRDMDVRALGFAYGVTPFEDIPAELEFPPAFTQLPQGLCGSGDSFATGESVLHCDVVDMEAYAYAKVCRLEGAEFACAKYITDGADHAAAGEWSTNLAAAAAAFWQLYVSF
jgi:adenosylhomocysteine nucleosidase